jgi:hypothetical protein
MAANVLLGFQNIVLCTCVFTWLSLNVQHWFVISCPAGAGEADTPRGAPRASYGSVEHINILKRRLHFEVRIRSSPPYPCSDGASHAGGGRVELCARRISRDPIGFRVRWCGFRCLFQSTVIIIGDSCWSSALVLWGLSMTIPHLYTTTSSTTISFARLQW